MLVEKDISWTHIPSPLDGLRWPEIVHSSATGGLRLVVGHGFAKEGEPKAFSVAFEGRVEAFSAVDEQLFVFTTGPQPTGALSVTDDSPELDKVKAADTGVMDDGLRHYLLLGGSLQWQVLTYKDPTIAEHADFNTALAALRKWEAD